MNKLIVNALFFFLLSLTLGQQTYCIGACSDFIPIHPSGDICFVGLDVNGAPILDTCHWLNDNNPQGRTNAGDGCACDDMCVNFHDCCPDYGYGCMIPVIAILNPSGGPTEGGGFLSISGSFFLDTQGQGNVTIDSFDCPVVNWTDTSITCIPPPGSGLGKPVIVNSENYFQTQSNAVDYDFDGPVITSNLPPLPTEGGDILILDGLNFGIDPSPFTLTVASAPANIQFRNHTHLSFELPPGQGASIALTVDVDGQTDFISFSYSPPSISTIFPVSSPTLGTTLTLIGSNFGLDASVTIASVSCPKVFQNHTFLNCTVPPGQGQSKTVKIVVGNQYDIAPVLFGYQSPFLERIHPTETDTDFAGILTIFGENFGESGVSINFGDDPCVSMPFSNHTALECEIPPGEGSGISISVQVCYGGNCLSSNSLSFSFSSPNVTGVTPILGCTTGGHPIFIEGANFGLNPAVIVDSSDCPVISSTHTSINCTLPPGQGMNNELIVTVGGQTASWLYDYHPPNVSYLLPVETGTQGGDTLHIHGTNFGSSSMLSSVTIGGETCLPIGAGFTHEEITCNIPPGVGRNLPVVVTIDGNANSDLSFNYSFPVLNNVTALSFPTSGEIQITLQGENFGLSPHTIVKVDGSPCQIQGQILHDQVIFTLPPGNLTSTVTLEWFGYVSNSKTITYDDPHIQSINPSSGITEGGTPVIILGTSFDVNGTITIGGSVCDIQTYDHSVIQCLTPPGQGQFIDVNLTTSSGRTSTGVDMWNYFPPSISSVSPSYFDTDGGIMTITGSNFGNSPEVLLRLDNGGPQLTTVLTHFHTNITCEIPPQDGKSHSVQVRTGTLTSDTRSFFYFPPTIQYIDPNSGPTRGNTPIEIIGFNFGLSGTISIYGQPCVVDQWSHTNITCFTPPGEGAEREVEVTVDTQTSNSVHFSYDGPSLATRHPPFIATNGSIPLTLTGSSFGVSPSVQVGGLECIVSYYVNDTIICDPPKNEGENLVIKVFVSTIPSNPLTVSYSPPEIYNVIESFGPTQGQTEISVFGTNFGLTASVQVGTSSCSWTFRDHNQINCILPSGQGINRPLTVKVLLRSSDPYMFSYSSPNITSISPSNYSTSGNAVVLISGSNFGSLSSPHSYVTIGGQICQPTGTMFSHTTIECVLPPGSGSDLPVFVSVSGQTDEKSIFSHNPPHIDGISPTSGPTSGLIPIIISGSSFSHAGSSTVRFNSTECQITQNSHSQITCLLPVGRLFNYITVNTTNQFSNAYPFSYDSPMITSVFPSSGPTSGGMLITMTGSSFDTSGVVKIDGKICAIHTYNQSKIICYLPEGSGYARLVQVTTTVGGLQTDNSSSFNYLKPLISRLTPDTDVPTQGNILLTLDGQNFGDASHTNAVQVDGKNCTSVYHNHTQINCTLPSGQGLNRPVIVTINGQISNTADLSFGIPFIDSIYPTNGTTQGGVLLTLMGTNFGTNPSITVGGLQCIGSGNHTVVVCSLPAGQGHNKQVRLISSSQISNIVLFSYNNPSIDSISPTSAETQGNISLTITGRDFGVTSLVTVGGVSCPHAVPQNHTHIICTLPAGEGVNHDVKVIVSSIPSTPLVFSYNPPYIYSVSPSSTGPTQGQNVITVFGVNFGYSGYVTVDGQTCIPDGPMNDSFIQCRVPTGEGQGLNLSVSVASQISNYLPFDYDAPTILDVNPDNGPTSGGISVLIDGSSFGTNGLVTIGGIGCPIVVGSYTHYQIRCTLPSGEGQNKSVIVTVSGQDSNPWDFNYDRPTITSVSRNTGATEGGTILIVNGKDFGTSGNVTIGGKICVVTGSGYSHDRVECLTPPGQGTNDILVVSGRTSLPGFFFWTYDNPVVSSVIPTTGSTAGLELNITGHNFGGDFSLITVTNCTATAATHDWLTCNMQPGTGKDLTMKVYVDSLPSANFFWSYAPPVVSSVSGCNDSAPMTHSCPIAGGLNITITGSNFGETNVNVTVTVDEISSPACYHEPGSPHNVLVCELPINPAGGFSLPVKVSVNGQSGTANLLSYAGPELYNDICFENNCIPASNIVYTGTDGENIQFSGRNFQTSATRTVIYQVPGFEKQYSCASPIVAGNQGEIQTITCAIDSDAVGMDLLFKVQIDSQWSLDSVFSLSYSPPAITNLTIRSEVSTPIPTSGQVSGSSSEGQPIYFNAENIGSDPDVLVVYYGNQGPVNHLPPNLLCSDVQIPQTGVIRCTTQPGEGMGYSFAVKALNQWSIPHDQPDLYNYPISPIIYHVSGCNNYLNATYDCPTDGGTEIIIVGDHFSDNEDLITVKIGAGDCLVTETTTNQVKCTLPAGAGFDRTVVVIHALKYSRGKDYLSYSAPSLSIVSGCSVQNGPNTEDCYRGGGETIDITGTNFGFSNALVLIGGLQTNCSHVLGEEHTHLQCLTPIGNALNRTVILIQSGGELSISPLYLSYEQCPAGTKVDGLSCSPCPTGSYTSGPGQLDCVKCDAGFYAFGTNNIKCTKCISGTYSVLNGTEGPSFCTPCPQATYGNSPALTTCFNCPVGTSNNLTEQYDCPKCPKGYSAPAEKSLDCTECLPGYFAGVEGSVSCDICSAGTFSNTSHASSCTQCTPGKFQTFSGRTSCEDCPIGSAISSSAQAVCIQCDPGTFANETELTSCYKCPVGTYSAKTGGIGASACTSCSAGQYAPTEGQADNCLTCPPGTYSSSGASSCTKCSIGSASSLFEATACAECLPGTYADTSGLISCKDCPPGSMSNSTNSTECIPCQGGTYQPLEKQTECIICLPGSAVASLTQGQVECPLCSAGTYSNINGSTSCLTCGPGTYSASGATDCSSCIAGSASFASGQEICELCPAGTFSKNSADSCTPCPIGTYSDIAESTECKNCTAGEFNTNIGSVLCKKCEAGSFNDQEAADSCPLCTPGTAQDLPGKSQCYDCGPGQYSATSGALICIPCPTGTFSNGTSNDICMTCPAGTHQPSSQQTSCIDCIVGTYLPAAGQANCIDCPEGEYSNVPASESCVKCTPGHYSPSPRSSQCLNCTAGSYSAYSGSWQCLDCPIGTYSESVMQSECQQCSPGTYQHESGKTGCILCPNGTHINSYGSSYCDSCPPGQFGDRPGLAQCDLCPMGTKNNPVINPTVCLDCDAGDYAPGTGSLVCTPCPTGKFSFSKASICTPCPPGKYSDIIGSSICSDCDYGTATSSYGKIACPSCVAGTYSNTTGLESCVSCPIGHFSGPGASECSKCLPGTYTNTEGSQFCVDCPLGYHSQDFGGTSCDICPPGTYADSLGSVNCSECILGMYSHVSGSISCQSCSFGTFNTQAKSMTCELCSPGLYQDQLGKTLCSPCLPGSYAPSNGSVSCTLCEKGTFGNVSNLFQCSDCPVGTYQSSEGKTSCFECPEGTYSNAEGAISCSICPVGEYTNASTGYIFCQKCPSGHYADNPQSSTCYACSAGSYSVGVGSYECIDCPVGTYSSFDGTSTCTPCPRGFYAPSIHLTGCLSCPKGRFNDITGSPFCNRCPIGQYNNAVNSTGCTLCSPGSTTSFTGSTQCSNCLEGTFSSQFGALKCDPCPTGTYSNTSGLTLCVSCGEGQYQDVESQSLCKECAEGTYNAALGQHSCKPCPSGTYSPDKKSTSCINCSPGSVSKLEGLIGAVNCTLCPYGHYMAQPGQMFCMQAPPGHYVNRTGAQTVTKCPPGHFSNLPAADICQPCEAGTYSTTEGKTSCDKCQPGTYAKDTKSFACSSVDPGYYQNAVGQTVQLPCLPGYFSDASGSIDCSPCQSGTYNPGSSRTQCDSCPIGFAQPLPNSLECEACLPGTFLDAIGQASCEPCSPGYYSTELNSTSCSACPSGKVQILAGQTTCDDCPSGFFSSGLGKPSCTPCPAGFFGNSSGLTQCYACSPGSYTAHLNASSCDDCGKGTYSLGDGTAQCIGCPTGTFGNTTGASLSDCHPCPRGTFTDEIGQIDNCQACTEGSFGLYEGAILCEDCDLGFYQDEIQKTVCKQCQAGTYANTTGSKLCMSCPEGTFGTSLGTINCEPCLPGYFSDIRGASSCERCPAGTHKNTPGATACDVCPMGEATNLKGQQYCQKCRPGYFQNMTNTTECVPCPIATFQINEGSTTCETCLPGYYNNQEGQPNCIACPEGTTSLGGVTECSSCGIGHYGTNGSCLPCPEGHHGDFPGLSVCKLCPLGTYMNESGAEFCKQCPPGSVARDQKQLNCTLCPPGTYQDRWGGYNCTDCPAGKSNNEWGAAMCNPCGVGTYDLDGVCTPCPAGTYSEINGSYSCSKCQAGTFSLDGWSQCQPCPVRTYQDQEGKSDCLNCQAGFYADVEGLVTCRRCEGGTYTNLDASLNCMECSPGTVAPHTGATACDECLFGYHNTKWKQTLCDPCEFGSYSDSTGAINCTLCPSGSFAFNRNMSACEDCPVGTSNNQTGQATCSPCFPGLYQNDTGQDSCVKCGKGTYSNADGASSCHLCPPGTYTDVDGLSSCFPCPHGQFNDEFGATQCHYCPPGSITMNNRCTPCLPGYFAPNSSSTCDLCQEGMIAPEPGMSACIMCDKLSRSNPSRTLCSCISGYYAVYGSNATNQCEACPWGAECRLPGNTWDNIKPKSGYWRNATLAFVPPGSLSFYRCLVEENCRGNDTCFDNHQGALCQQCDIGFHITSAGECVSCPSSTETYLFFFLVITGCILGLIALCAVTLRAGRDLLMKAKAHEILRLHEEEFNYVGDKQSIISEPQNIAAIQLLENGEIQPQPNFMYKLKIIISFLQIATAVTLACEMPWPRAYRSFMSTFNLANLDIIEFASIECLFETNFYMKFSLVSFLPFLIVICLLLFYLVPKYITSTYTKVDPHYNTRALRGFWKMVLFVLFLMYPITSRSTMTFFKCKRVEGIEYLFSDFRSLCGDSTWQSWFPVGVILVIVYPIGIPLLFSYMLFKYRRVHHKEDVQAQLGFLYAAYNPDVWWFEIVDMLHKLFLTSLIIFFPLKTQMLVGMLASSAYTLIILVMKPYVRKGDDRLHLFAQCEIYLLLFAGYCFEEKIEASDYTNNLLSAVLIIMTVGFFLFFLVQLFGTIKKLWKDAKKAKAEKKLTTTDEVEMKIVRKELAEDFGDAHLQANPLFASQKGLGQSGLLKGKLNIDDFETNETSTSPGEGEGEGDTGEAGTEEAVSGIPAILDRAREMSSVKSSKQPSRAKKVAPQLPPPAPIQIHKSREVGVFKRSLPPTVHALEKRRNL